MFQAVRKERMVNMRISKGALSSSWLFDGESGFNWKDFFFVTSTFLIDLFYFLTAQVGYVM